MQPARTDANAIAQSVAGELLFVADCGGTKTAAWLVGLLDAETYRILGEAHSSSANPLSVGFDSATKAIEESLRIARSQANLEEGRHISRALLSIAGAANREVADKFIDWAREKRLAQHVAIVSDVLPILAAGTRDCCGIALISGTGSSAFGRAAGGRAKRCGGWGYLLGDEGSGYAIGRAALQVTMRSLEAEGPQNPMAEAVLNELDAGTITEMTKAVYGNPDPRRRIASLASIVCKMAGANDPEAFQILETAAAELASLVARTAASIGFVDSPFPIAVSGGVLIHSKPLQDRLVAALESLGLEFTFNVVREPLTGCVRLAALDVAGEHVTWHKT
jgi:N-acetylglucosamine kinase-like BadF-type ATPase